MPKKFKTFGLTLACLTGLGLVSCGETSNSSTSVAPTTSKDTTVETSTDQSTSEETTSQETSKTSSPTTTEETTSSFTITEETTSMSVNRAREVEEIRYVTGVKSKYVLHEYIDPSSITAYIKYKNQTALDMVKAPRLKLTYSQSLTATIGNKSLSVSYLGVSKVVDFKVVDTYDVEIQSLEAPASVLNSKKSFDIASTDKNGFLLKDFLSYDVGYENSFNIFPTIRAIATNDLGEATPVVLNDCNLVAKLYANGSGDEIIDKTIGYQDENDKFSFHFTQEATKQDYDYTIKLSILNDATVTPVSFKVKVVKGYNVYNLNDLILFDNTGKYKDFKVANGYPADLIAKDGIVLQSSIQITPEYLPDSFFFSAEDVKNDADKDSVVGTINRDKVGTFFERYITSADTSEFTLDGNGFTINAANVPFVSRLGEHEMSTFNIFNFQNPKDDNTVHIPGVKFFNMKFIGNDPKNENQEGRGGAIMIKNDNTSFFEISNCVANSCFIVSLTENNTVETNIEYLKAYDSFSTFLYNWGCPTYNIYKSTMNSCGGPIIISDTVGLVSEADHTSPNTTFTDCDVNSEVAGTEGWFQITGVTAMVGTIKLISDLMVKTGNKGFTNTVKDGTSEIVKFNLICVNKNGSAQTLDGTPCDGTTKFVKTLESGEEKYPMVDYTNPLIGQLKASALNAAPIIVPNGDLTKSSFYTNSPADALFNVVDAMSGNYVVPSAGQLDGEYLSLYLPPALSAAAVIKLNK
jgi:hypothetical protein